MIDAQQIEQLLALYPVLGEIDDDQLTDILGRASLVRLSKGDMIFNPLDPCRAFPFVLEGRLRVFKQSAGGRELSLYYVTPGEACIVTAGCLLGREAYNASGQVKEDTAIIMMAEDDFNRTMGNDRFRAFVFSLISGRIVELMQLVEEVAFHRLDKRLAGLLLDRGRILNVSHQELADELGTVREMVSRLLSGFADTGMIRLGRGRIEVLDRNGLSRIQEKSGDM